MEFDNNVLYRIDDLQWRTMFLQYVEWRKTSTYQYPRRNKDPKSLYHWCANNKRNLNKIDFLKRSILISIGFEVASKKAYRQKDEVIWNDMLNQYLEWRKTSNYKIYPTEKNSNKKLYNWVRNNRTFFTKGKQITKKRIQILKDLGFTTTSSRDKYFKQRFQELIEYKKLYRTCHVRQDLKSPYYKLARWVNSMRDSFREDTLEYKYVEQLESIGFKWNMLDERFFRKFRKLKTFYNKHGHFDVSNKDNKKLAAWIATIRCRPPQTQRYVTLLNSIGFKWKNKRTRVKDAIQTMNEIDIKVMLREMRKKTKSVPNNQ